MFESMLYMLLKRATWKAGFKAKSVTLFEYYINNNNDKIISTSCVTMRTLPELHVNRNTPGRIVIERDETANVPHCSL